MFRTQRKFGDSFWVGDARIILRRPPRSECQNDIDVLIDAPRHVRIRLEEKEPPEDHGDGVRG